MRSTLLGLTYDKHTVIETMTYLFAGRKRAFTH